MLVTLLLLPLPRAGSFLIINHQQTSAMQSESRAKFRILVPHHLTHCLESEQVCESTSTMKSRCSHSMMIFWADRKSRFTIFTGGFDVAEQENILKRKATPEAGRVRGFIFDAEQ